MDKSKQSFQNFVIIWLGQLLSVVGTGMTQFALAIWIWDETGEATPVALVTLFFFLPTVVVGPLAGVLVDRWNRKFTMIGCDSLAGVTTISLAILFFSGDLQVWHLYIAAFLSGAFNSLQVPAMSASVSMLVERSQYTRAAGMMGLSETLAQIISPALGALLYVSLNVGGILMIDILTFVIGVATLAMIHIPQPTMTEDGARSRGSILHEMLFGFRYIAEKRQLLYLLVFIIVVNVILMLWVVLLSPMVLARTGNDQIALGMVQAAGGIGAVLGGIVISLLGAPKNNMNRFLLGLGLIGILTLPIGFQNTIIAWALAHFLYFALHSIIGAYYHAIWQAKVAPDVQGRVFAVRRLSIGISSMFAPLMIGVLADHWFEPAMNAQNTMMADLLGWFVGTDSGSGMAAMFVLGSIGLVGLAIVGYVVRDLRDVEDILMDAVPA